MLTGVITKFSTLINKAYYFRTATLHDFTVQRSLNSYPNVRRGGVQSTKKILKQISQTWLLKVVKPVFDLDFLSPEFTLAFLKKWEKNHRDTSPNQLRKRW